MEQDASRCDPELAYLSPLYTVGRSEGMSAKEIEGEERKQEDVMKRFRSRDCNILVATSVLEDGIDVPACHLVVRYDLPQSYRAYVHSKARARARRAHYVLMVKSDCVGQFLADLSQFHATEQILLGKSGYQNAPVRLYPAEEKIITTCDPYPNASEGSSKSSVTLNNAITLINRLLIHSLFVSS